MKVTSLLFLFLVPFVLQGQPASFLHLMEQDSAFDLFLKLDWKKLHRNKKEKDYQSASVRCASTQQDTLNLLGKVRTRGHMRLDICSFPPIKLKIDKNELSKYHLTSHNELKIVHHCYESETDNQLILKEYLTYKLWELVSPYFFKTQLIRLHYIDTDGTEAYGSTLAFLLENEEELTDRLSARLSKVKVMSKSAIERKAFLRVCLFEFMIGNTDWYIPTRHNLEFVALPDHTLLVPIPYDFDYSGLVDASYATPHESLNLADVSIRFYQGWCEDRETILEELKIFHAQKEKILALPDHIQGLSDKSKHQVIRYLEDFFDIIENPKKLENQIIRHCNMWPPEN